MPAGHLFVYSDGSFDRSLKAGFTGYLILSSLEKHAEPPIAPSIVVEQIEAPSNIAVELAAACRALNAAWRMISKESQLPTTSTIELFTDCRTVVELPSRRPRLEASCYISKRSGEILTNAAGYRDFFDIYDKLAPRITWIKGHLPRADRGYVEQNFREVDQAVRRAMRAFKRM